MLQGGCTLDSQQRPEGNRGGRSNIATDEKAATQMKEIRGSFTLIDQHWRWVKGLSESAGEVHWENNCTAAYRSVRQQDKKLMICIFWRNRMI